MCGIVGYAGNHQAAPVLLDGLSKLEYRGYDSAGICVHSPEGLQIEKAKGRLKVLQEKTNNGVLLQGCSGIGHTRWATHGAPSDVNSHPHLSFNKKIALVHNGIIENEAALRTWLEAQKITFRSQTDTEVIANLIGYYYDRARELTIAIRKAMARLVGSYALGILCQDLPGTVIAVKKDSPLVFGFGEQENFIASDVPAILKYTNRVVYLNDGEMAIFTARAVVFLDAAGEKSEKQPETVNWAPEDAQMGGYESYMLKEIFEQPRAVRDTATYIKEGRVHFDGFCPTWETLVKIRRICFVACGSAHYVSLVGKHCMEKMCRIPAEAFMASEFRYAQPVVDERDLVIAISQSGETADTLSALKEAKRLGANTLAIVNVVGSAIAKQADHVIYTLAGPEIAVATTKAFSAQLTAIYLLTVKMAQTLNTIPEADIQNIAQCLKELPGKIEDTLNSSMLTQCQYYANRYCGHHNAFYIGRNLDSAICLEGSLKLKEIAYLHSEAYPAGELKHGPISLIESGTLVVALATAEPLLDKVLSNIREVTARGGDVLCITLEDQLEKFSAVTENCISVPRTHPMLQPSLSLLPLQLFAYYVAANRGCDVDKPRNLAKSVTVE